jgi:GNAT superfamily N-acetyltransferase
MVMAMKLDFRSCLAEDVTLLDHINPTPSIESFHRQRFARQQAGTSSFVLAWLDGSPVGHAEIRWNGCGDPQVRIAHPRCPEINGLEVFPVALRSRGIGRRLIAHCEQFARQRGYRQIGLGVADVNPRAARLYLSLGYDGSRRYLDRYSCLDSTGTRHRFADPCRFLTRRLSDDHRELCHRANEIASKSGHGSTRGTTWRVTDAICEIQWRACLTPTLARKITCAASER